MKAKEMAKALLGSHIFWAAISFSLVLLFTGLTQYDYGWNWKTTALVVSSILFVLFGLGAVGLSVFNLVINLVRKIKKKK
jgi:TRAP-type C4-dicarboxylate transport system permease small subunit